MRKVTCISIAWLWPTYATALRAPLQRRVRTATELKEKRQAQ